MTERSAVLALLRAPEHVRRWRPARWAALLREARNGEMLGRLHVTLGDCDLLEAIPPRVRTHLAAGALHAERRAQALRHEINCLHRALALHALPVVVLKGGAYIARRLDAARGRNCHDLDILVPSERLREAEALLADAGWVEAQDQPYDQRYYRRWMHELPPLHHVRRGSTLDVHHRLLPRMAVGAVPSLWAHADPLPEWPGFFTLSSIDMVLHSAAHLFHEGELTFATRGLVDLDSLLRAREGDEAWWDALDARAAQLGLTPSLDYALVHVPALLGTPARSLVRSRSLRARAVDRFYSLSLAAPETRRGSAAIARFMLYVRGHWLRMSPFQLLPHLLRKTARRLFSASGSPAV